MLSKDFDYDDKKFEVEVEFKPLCCGHVFKENDILAVYIHKTSNRLLVKTTSGGYHNVKRSTLNRCCILLEE
jgi:hypothetical protein